jgi:hypothetical protein
VSICEFINLRRRGPYPGRSVRRVYVIPAIPGWALAEPLRDLSDNRNSVTEFKDEPLIGWAIETLEPEGDKESVVIVDRRPIVADWSCDPDDCFIRRPNGSLFIPGDCYFGSDAEAIAYLEEEHTAEERRKGQRTASVKGGQQ